LRAVRHLDYIINHFKSISTPICHVVKITVIGQFALRPYILTGLRGRLTSLQHLERHADCSQYSHLDFKLASKSKQGYGN